MGSVRPDGRQLDAAVTGLGAARRPASWATRGPSARPLSVCKAVVLTLGGEHTATCSFFLLFFNFYIYVFSQLFQLYPPLTFFN